MSVETHFENIQEEIVSKLKKAEKQILVAVAWLTDQRLFDILCIQADNFIDVQVLIVNDEVNLQSGIDYQKLVKAGGKLYWQENISQSLMHHKFCIIDKKTVITGSYNWTNKAQSNIENIIVLENETKASNDYLNEFINLVPKFQEANFFDPDYKPADYINTPEKRLQWFNTVPEEIKHTFFYYGRRLLYKYDDEGYVTYSENLDDNIAAILNMPEILFSGWKSLEPLEHLSNLREISGTTRLGKTECLDLSPLKNLINLKVLKLNENRICDLTPLSKLKKLERLYLRKTNIKSLRGLESLKNLSTLDLSYNMIESLDEISGLTKLTDLNIQNNYVQNIDFLSMNKQLTELQLGFNQIKDISCLSSCSRLTRLGFSNNLVEDISPLQNLKCLVFISGSGNPISKERIKYFKSHLKSPYYDNNINL